MNQFSIILTAIIIALSSQKFSIALSINEFKLIQIQIQGLHKKGGSDFAGAILRLFFHDAAAGPTAFNGCVDLNSQANAGVRTVHADLEIVLEQFKRVISRSDLWVLATSVVIMDSIPKGTHTGMDLVRDYKWGRADGNCDGSNDNLPGPTGGIQTVMEKMVQRLGLSIPEVVALMGGHSLGRADGSAGFVGEFTSDPGLFTNSYYKIMLNGKYKREGDAGGWREQSSQTLLFSTDVCLAYNIELPGCAINFLEQTCPTDANEFNTRWWVENYSHNTALWHRFFSSAFIKISTGNNKLKKLTKTPTPADAYGKTKA